MFELWLLYYNVITSPCLTEHQTCILLSTHDVHCSITESALSVCPVCLSSFVYSHFSANLQYLSPPPTPHPVRVPGPLPAEHAPLQDILDRVRDACSASAHTAQARRRLDEASRRLELLYDLLRADSLSPGTVQGLHQLAHWLRCSDWTSAQHQLSALVAASNMAEIAGFMPGIKSLLQLAAQMQVGAGDVGSNPGRGEQLLRLNIQIHFL